MINFWQNRQNLELLLLTFWADFGKNRKNGKNDHFFGIFCHFFKKWALNTYRSGVNEVFFRIFQNSEKTSAEFEEF